MVAETLHVLLIEDNPADANLVQEYLAEGTVQETAFILEWVERLSTGLERLERGGARDVLLLDLSLPDSQGLEGLDRVIDRHPTLPILILTGIKEEALGLEAIRKGAQDYLIKGQLTGPLLARTIRHAVERSRIREQLRQQEEHLRLLSEQLPAVLWTTDGDLRFTSCLGASLHHLKLVPAEVVGRALSEYCQSAGPDFPPIVAHRRALLGESTTSEVDWMERTFHVRVEPLRQGSHIIGVVGVALDITEHRRVEEAFEIARQIQKRLLPRSNPALLNLDVGGCAFFAEATGGDFFDFIPLADNSIGIAIGDASGHGVGAALLAAIVHASLRTLALTGLAIDLPAMLSTSNRLLCEVSEDDKFVTLLLARLDPVTRSLTYSSAGHHPGFILDSTGKLKTELHSTGLLLGTLPEETYPTPPAVTLAPGDIVVFITDGVLDVTSADEKVSKVERMLNVVRGLREKSAQSIAEGICGAALAFTQEVPQCDDVTAVVVKVGQ